MSKQLELPGVIHRCRRCWRPLKSKASIKRGMGAKCAKHDAELDKVIAISYPRGLCGRATLPVCR